LLAAPDAFGRFQHFGQTVGRDEPADPQSAEELFVGVAEGGTVLAAIGAPSAFFEVGALAESAAALEELESVALDASPVLASGFGLAAEL
jgi:hypothetical protein